MKGPLSALLFLSLSLTLFPACAESNNTDAGAEAAVSDASTLNTAAPVAPSPDPVPAETVSAPPVPANAEREPTPPPAPPTLATDRKSADVPRSPKTTPPSSTSADEPEKTPAPNPPEPPAAPTPPDHSQWNQLLQQHVNASGKVDYAGLRQQQDQLDAYLDKLAQAVPGKDWSRNTALAYWLNAYNAFTIKLILDNWPVQSIKNIGNGNPWDDQWIELAGKNYSLNQIENDIIRPRFKDPRIHFAVNCAAVSCPPLHNRAFTAADVDRTLEQLTRSFINNSRFNTISASTATVSKVFDWYGQDFGTLHEYLDRYAEASVTADTEIQFKDYDWALNN